MQNLACMRQYLALSGHTNLVPNRKEIEMKKIICMLLGAVFSIGASTSNAISVTDIGIKYVGIYGNGRVFASLDKAVPVTGCTDATWLQIGPDHPLKDKIYSMLLAAHMSGKKIDITATGCFAGQATIVDQSSDYVLVK